MGGSTADTPTTPEFLRVSDADRDHAVNELRDEFVEGRLSHETFVYRMQTALDARNHGQLANLFTDLPPRRARLMARIKAALRDDEPRLTDKRAHGVSPRGSRSLDRDRPRAGWSATWSRQRPSSGGQRVQRGPARAAGQTR